MTLLVATFGSITGAWAQAKQIRIAVVSDIHVMAPSLLENVSNTQEWTDYYAGQRKMLEQSAGLFDQFVETMIAKKPDVLLITGDLTKDGEVVSHEYVKAGLLTLENTLKSNDTQVYVIPGNHDLVESTEDDDVLSTANFATFYADYGYGTDSTPGPNGSLSYVTDIADGLTLLAIDSHSGSVPTTTLTWLCNQAQTARSAGKRVIAMMHHPLFPHIEGADMFISTYTVDNYQTVRNALIDAGVNVILTGHFHTSDIAYDWNDDANNGIYDINTGSLISYPCDYRMLTLSADKTTLEVATESLTPTGWTAEACKTWLHDRVAAMVVAKGYNQLLGGYAADAFVIHAEGDENSSNDANKLLRTYASLKPMASFFHIDPEELSSLEPIFYSTLTDISNYEDGTLTSGHENRTADRALSITLTAPNTLLLGNNTDNSTAVEIYNTKTANVTLSGRTLFKDVKWNTICLPFNVDLTAEGCPLAGADVRELSSTIEYEGKTTGLDENGVLTLNFTAQNGISELVAGTPYIIKWESGDNIVSPVFSGVTIDKTDRKFTGTGFEFKGTYDYMPFDATNTSFLFMGADDEGSKLYYPMNGASIGACRAYFQITSSAKVRAFNLNFGDEETGIISIENGKMKIENEAGTWYNLNGVRVEKPARKGVYIQNGRKVVIK